MYIAQLPHFSSLFSACIGFDSYNLESSLLVSVEQLDFILYFITASHVFEFLCLTCECHSFPLHFSFGTIHSQSGTLLFALEQSDSLCLSCQLQNITWRPEKNRIGHPKGFALGRCDSRSLSGTTSFYKGDILEGLWPSQS